MKYLRPIRSEDESSRATKSDEPSSLVEARGGTTGSKGQVISFFAADFMNDF